MKLKKIIRRFRSNSYLHYCQQPIKEQMVLLEAGQGKNVNGNMFAMVREICENPAYQQLRPVFVVTSETEEDAKQRFAFYGYQVATVIRNTDEYKELLATSKYLMTDNSFPPYFAKRDEQVYLNTWHGTPLKTLGKSDIKNAKSLANIQKNYLMCDYALFPNHFTETVFMKDYMLKHLYKGKVVLCDYPRNKALLRDQNLALRTKLGLDEKQLIAYMPTWRGTSREADAKVQKEILHAYFQQIDQQLRDDQIFYVNLHFLLGNTMDFSFYQHIRPFPAAYETYDFLGICDMLVTDYSSVFFDFAVSEKKVILFAYDLEEYMHDRGTYFPVEDLPFPIVKTVDELIREINHEQCFVMPKEFLATYCNYRDANVPGKLMELMLHGKQAEVKVINAANNEKELLLIYGGKLANKRLNEQMLSYVAEMVKKHEDQHCILCFSGAINQKKVAFLSELPEQMDYLALVSRFEFFTKDRVKAALAIKFKWFSKLFDKKLQSAYEAERKRMYYHLQPVEVIYYGGTAQYMYKLLGTFEGKKTAHLHNCFLMGLMCKRKSYRSMKAYLPQYYDHIIDHQGEDVHSLWREEEHAFYYNKVFRMGNISYHMKNTKAGMKLSAFAVAETMLPELIQKLSIRIADKLFPSHMRKICNLGNGLYLVKYSFVIPYQDVKELDIQNKINLVYTDAEGYGVTTGIKYNLFHRRRGKNQHGPIHILEQSKTSAYFRQTVNNVLYFTVRKKNITDSKIEQLKLFLAYHLSHFYPKKGIILLFEKESERYEESASVLYEKLIDKGYENAYFILSADYDHLNSVPKQYRHNLIYKGTFRHYLYFFKSRTFLGSEALVHAIDLRISNRYAQRKLNDNTLDYVFLQHGVMYMVSLDSESRKFFKPKKTKGKYRVVVSSQEEANHFVELGRYDLETIYISGLPKYDRNVLYDDADKIVIMPTWRPWEYNQARYDFTLTNYYQMICRIFNAIPVHYHSKVIILPHPLFYDAVKNANFALKPYLNHDAKYDDILKQTKVLITDYSSIAYDAFYRGSNILFYWEEKDACMEAYGPTTKLMLDQDNVFGHTCYRPEEVTKIFEEVYHGVQDVLYQQRYQKLVQFHDGNNTERLIHFLENDNII